MKGQEKCSFMTLHDTYNKDPEYAAWRDTGAQSWSQAWRRGLLTSAWGPSLCPRDPAGPSPKQRHELTLQLTTHPQEDSKVPSALWIGSRSRQGPWLTDPWLCKLAMGPLAWIIKSSVKVKPPKTKMGLKNCTKIKGLLIPMKFCESSLNYLCLNWLNSGMCIRLW